MPSKGCLQVSYRDNVGKKNRVMSCSADNTMDKSRMQQRKSIATIDWPKP